VWHATSQKNFVPVGGAEKHYVSRGCANDIPSGEPAKRNRKSSKRRPQRSKSITKIAESVSHQSVDAIQRFFFGGLPRKFIAGEALKVPGRYHGHAASSAKETQSKNSLPGPS
jgi:hypothetical protein